MNRLQANRSLLAARSMEDLVAWSGGLHPSISIQKLVTIIYSTSNRHRADRSPRPLRWPTRFSKLTAKFVPRLSWIP